MNKPLKLLLSAAAIYVVPMLILFVTANRQNLHWKEEVQMVEGQTIVVERSLKRWNTRFYKLGWVQSSSIIVQGAEFKSHEGHSPVALGRAADGAIVLVTSSREPCNPGDRFSVDGFKLENGKWVQMNRVDIPFDAILDNLWGNLNWRPNRQGDLEGTVTLAEKGQPLPLTRRLRSMRSCSDKLNKPTN